MTTLVTIEVPESADYCVKVETTNYHQYVIHTIMPGDSIKLHIHRDLKILGIEGHKIGE
jgi:hypothetical protein